MSTGNGRDPATKQMVGVLLRMETGIGALNENMLALRADVTGIQNEMRSLRPELRADLDTLQERVARPEATVFKAAAE